VPERPSFDYAVIRVVPRVERNEFLNAGVIVFCRLRDFLAARVELDPARLLALSPDADPDEVARHLDLFPRVCAGGPPAGALGRLSLSERFNWLVQPSSTLIQASPVHSGLCDDPQEALDRLLDTAVRVPPSGRGPPRGDAGRGLRRSGAPPGRPRPGPW